MRSLTFADEPPRLRREASELVSAQYLKAKRTHLYPAHLSEQAFTGLYAVR